MGQFFGCVARCSALFGKASILSDELAML
jgi:hypothetical protein